MLVATMLAQLFVALAGSAGAMALHTPGHAKSVLWGGLTALANTALLTWRLAYGDRPTLNAQHQLRLMYRSSLERFFVVAMLLVLGVLQRELAPLPVLLGFLAGQLTLLVVLISSGMKSSKNGE